MERPAPELQQSASLVQTARIAAEPLTPSQNNQPPASSVVREAAGTDWERLLPLVYWLLAGAAFTMFSYQLALLIWHSRQTSERSGALKLVDKPKGFTDCSFFNYVFIDRNKSAEALQAMLQHESIHARKLHSLDKVLVSLFKCFLWFNPFIYLYDRAIEQVHEYEADDMVSASVGNAVYANLLLSLAVRSSSVPLTHSFVKNPVKERIKMLFINPSKNMKKLTYLTLVPAGLALVGLFGVQVVYAESESNFVKPFKYLRQTEEPALHSGPGKTAEGKDALSKKQAQPEIKEKPEAPLRLIDNVELGENPLVVIDGREYPPEILTRISPACMSSGKFSNGKVEITTWKNQIIYATVAEIETAKVRRKTKAEGRFYNRYPVTIGGHKRDEILVRFGNSFSEAAFPVGYKIALLIDGKIISEKEALKMSGNPAYHVNGVDYKYAQDEPELFGKYGSQYDLILQFGNEDASATKANPDLTRGAATVVTQSGDEKFEYRATDSTSYSADKRYLTLFGNAHIINGKRSTLKGDKIRFDAKTRTAIVQNASVTFEGKKKAVEGALLKVNIDHGTYEVLAGTPDF
jgi:hypothetical protein